MTDIVERLRREVRVIFDQPEGERAMVEAADEIERLRSENKEYLRWKNELVLKCYSAMDECDALKTEIERLRERNAELERVLG